MSVRVALAVTCVLILTGLAGCAQETKPLEQPSPPQAPAPPAYEAPALPKILAPVYLKGLSDFVKAYPFRGQNVDSHVAARDALAKEFESMGLPVWRQDFTGSIAQQNVCAVKLGVVAPTEWVVVGGHFDTITVDDYFTDLGTLQAGSYASEGAYDDGSGTWMTVELARAYAKLPTYYSVLFCAFDGEELGLEGSRAVFEAMDVNSTAFPYPYEMTRAMLDIDMYGLCWPVRTPIDFMHNNKILFGEADRVRKLLQVPDDFFRAATRTNGGGSDYAHWMRAEVPTVYLSSSFGQQAVPTPVPNPVTDPVPMTYPWWHWQDTMETMTAMAGGPLMLEASFQTGLDLAVAITHHMVATDVELDPPAPAA